MKLKLDEARFLWADSSNIWNGIDSVICDHYRLDIEIMENGDQSFKETDVFMKNIIKEEVTTRVLGFKRGTKRIIQSVVKNKNYPLPFLSKLKANRKPIFT